MFTNNDYIYIFIKNGRIYGNLTYMIIEKIIRFFKSLDKYCYKLIWSLNLANKNV